MNQAHLLPVKQTQIIGCLWSVMEMIAQRKKIIGNLKIHLEQVGDNKDIFILFVKEMVKENVEYKLSCITLNDLKKNNL